MTDKTKALEEFREAYLAWQGANNADAGHDLKQVFWERYVAARKALDLVANPKPFWLPGGHA